ncbi:ComEC/Rec2 family competence protein [Rhizobium sp. PDO1-076]|uniref:ComEC/Rec2 family competence protein n=1 Tax=Rhizobium sp. PDO1-076 TaxID=1125979 RepID=UPI001FCAE2FF|nr:ComEC/Rec2 family competence protein [Rhizobium sp. PDO1-076]
MSDLAQGETAMADAGAQVDVALPDIPPSVRRRAAVAKRTNPPFIYWRERCARLPALCTAAIALEARHGHLFHFVPVCLGAGAAVWFALSAPPPATVIACILTALLADICFQTAPATARHAMLCAATLTCAGMLLAEWETRRAATTMLDQPVVTIVTGVVERREAGASGEWRYVMRLTGTLEPTLRRPPQRISVLARSRHEPLAIGTLASGRARLSPPSGPALPGMNDFAFASYFSGIGAVGFFLGPPVAFTLPPVAPSGMGQLWLEFLPKSWGEFWLTADQSLFALRDQISIRIRTVVSGDPGAFAASIITGERRSMSEGATEALRLSGLAHITAISGLNMALAAGIFFVGLRAGLSLFPVLAQTYPVKKIAAAGALLAVTGYVMISGYQVSAVRAYLMTSIMLVAVLVDRPAISLRNLALAATLILIVQPSAVMGPSFQMSFAATAALIAGYAGWRSRPRNVLPRFRARKYVVLATFGRFFGGTLATSLIGGLATAIFAISHFHRLSSHSLEANLIAMPLISLVVMPAGFIAMILMPLGLDAPFLIVMGYGLEWVLIVAQEIAGWGDGYAFTRQPTWLLPMTVTGFLLLTLLRTRLRHAGTVVIVVTLLAAALSNQAPKADLAVSEDGRLVGFWPGTATMHTVDDQIATNRIRPPAFIFDQWQPALGIVAAITPQAMSGPAAELVSQDRPRRTPLSDAEISVARQRLRDLLASANDQHFTCIKGACAAMLRDWRIITLDRHEATGIACDLADLVIVAQRPGFVDCRSGAQLISAESLRSTGSLEIFLRDRSRRTLTVIPSFAGSSRPWTRHRLYDWRTGSQADSHSAERHSEW